VGNVNRVTGTESVFVGYPWQILDIVFTVFKEAIALSLGLTSGRKY
jgi:hypothetical protein